MADIKDQKDSPLLDQDGEEITGQPIVLDQDGRAVTDRDSGYTIAMTAGAYTTTGTAIGLLKGSGFGIDFGSYTTTGADIGLRKDSIIGVDAGAYALTGSDIDQKQAHYGRTQKT